MALVYATTITAVWAVVGLVFPLLGYFLGAWAGVTWLGGWRTRLWFLPKVILLSFLIALCTGLTVGPTLEDTPLPFEAARVSSVEKRQLVRLVQSKNPKSLEEGETHTLRLTENDLNIGSSWGLSSRSSGRKARLTIDRDSVSLSLSTPVSLGEGRSRYLNLQIAVASEIEDGVLSLHLSRCQIGAVRVPDRLLRLLCPLLTSFLNHDVRLKPLLNATKRMTIEPDSIHLTYGPFDWPAGIRQHLMEPAFADEKLLASVRTQVDHLVLLFAGNPLPDQPPSFNLCLKTAFALARDRSTEGDAVIENQAAIFALGLLIGHAGIGDFLGPVISNRSKDDAQHIPFRVTLYGRSDWTRHFCVSAAIAILTDETVSDACGLLKEELDTDADGSGFSFSDLSMDRAGTVFATWATRGEMAARTMQDRLVHGCRTEDICPRADDLPEGITETLLTSRFGGVDGEGYCQITREIEQRIAACTAYR